MNYHVRVALELEPQHIECARKIWEWYQLPGNEVGGPLHIVTDDDNVEDECLEYCRKALVDAECEYHGPNMTPERTKLGTEILDALQEMDEPVRSVVTGWFNPYADHPASSEEAGARVTHEFVVFS